MDSSPGDFDPVLLSQARLGVVALLLARREATFPEMKDLLGLTQGNLGTHLRALEDAGYVEVVKDFDGRKPRTTGRLTARGRKALERHVAMLERILREGDGAEPPATSRRALRR
jgi:DNA-binding MarR family transcriptional regulator